MFYTIRNDHLKVTVNSLGAELHSIQSADGTEYLWQGNPDVWDGQAPNIFPYVARLTEQKYTYDGKEYTMKIHGFINAVELTPEKQTTAMKKRWRSIRFLLSTASPMRLKET